MFKVYLAIMAGGGLGAMARFWLSGLLASRFGETFPLGTLVVNILGCFIIGIFTGMTGPDSVFAVPVLVRQFVVFGVLGGFTTFSSFSMQTFALMAEGQWLYAGANIMLSVFCCLVAVWLGVLLASVLVPG